MTIPHKIYNLSLSSAHGLMGHIYLGGSSTSYEPEFMPNDLSLDSGLDEMVRGEITYLASYFDRDIDPALDHFELNWGILPNLWHSYILIEVAAGADSQGIMHLRSYQAGVNVWLNRYQDNLVADGLFMLMSGYDPSAPNAEGEFVYYAGNMISLKIFFLNAVVNNISRLWAPTAGGVEVVLTGLGFQNTDADLNEGGDSTTWADYVKYIDFIGLQGQGTTQLDKDGGDFTIDSNSQITIPANKFPALSQGSYEIYLTKWNTAGVSSPKSYAGDWICDSSGRVSKSTRITFYISDVYVAREHRQKKAPKILIDFHLKAKSDGSEVMKYYSMDYVRCPDRVYKASLSAISAIPRGIDDKSGLFKITDLTLDLANNKQEFSKLLAGTTILKNQLVKIYQAYPDEPFGWRSHIITLIIDDYDLKSEIFKVKLKDITQKYFRRNVPENVCTEDEYPDIHPDSKGASIPEVLGLCSLTTGEFRGQVEALCIDTVNFKYVAANRALYSVDQVYADDKVAVSSSDYTVTVEDDGRTYITFTGDQENKKVTFNCKGYMYGGLNSSNNYVQNPAYIALYFLLVILAVPPTLIDLQSFDDLADMFDAMVESTAGKLVLQDQRNSLDVLEELVPGFSCFPAKDGRIKVGKKDISNYKTNNSDVAPVIISQIDMVEPLERKYNMRDAINLINADYDYIPTWNIFKSNVSNESIYHIDPWDPITIEGDKKSGVHRNGGKRPIRPWPK